MKKPWSVPYLHGKARMAWLAALLFALSPVHATTVTLTSGTSWTVPANVTSVTVQVWGGGGAGGGNTTTEDGGGGGGGGGYSSGTVTVTPGSITYTIGAGGTGGTGTGGSGGITTFNSSPVVSATGGAGGAPPVAGNGGLGGAGGSGTFSGGGGGTGRNNNTGTGGGGGSSAGTAANGNSGGNGGSTPGAGGTAPAGGGVGGNGGGSGANGFAPASGNGGGGGGSGDRTVGNLTGGNGTPGKIIITYKTDQIITFDAAPAVVVGGTGTVSATGGASGNPVTFTSTNPAVCTATGTNGATITGVTAGTCTIAANQAGNADYNAATQVTQTFTVTSAGPTATTTAASGLTAVAFGASWDVTLNGIVSSNGTSTVVSFEYGLTTAYGTSVPATQSPLAVDAVNTAVSAGLIGLNCNTTFHYRVKATGAGTGYGLNGTFTTGSCPGAPFGATDCAATRFGGNLGCTANDVNITDITLAPTGQQSSCVSGAPVTLDLDMTVNFASPDRWDVGIFIANDGKLPSLLPANGGASSCSVGILPITLPAYGYTFLDLDGAPMGTLDTCGDGNGSINDSAFSGGTVPLGDGVKRMTGVTMPCYASPDSLGKLFVPFVVSWDNQKSPIGGTCTSNQYPVPNTTSKCNAPLSSVPINVVVMPKINKTHSGASFNPGDLITYTITVFNDSGGTLQASFFKDPAVSGLAVTGLLCTPANGAACPIANNTVADMQGPTGIPIPSANLPNNSSLIFTVTGTLSGTTIDNTATVSIGLNTNSSTDSVTLGAASGSKSFAPNSITEDNNSLMTITFTNPTASAVTGVSFIDTYPSGLVNAASPNVSTTCGGSVTAIAGGLTFSGGTIPATGSCTVSVYVTSATASSYINSVSFTPGSLGSASATLSVTAAVIGAFDAGEVGTWDRASPDVAVTPHIYTKLAGTPFNLELAALKADLSRSTSYSSTVSVQLFDATGDSSTCPISSAFIGTPISVSFSPSNTNKGVVTVGPFPVSTAYRDVRVYVTETTGGNPKSSCSSNHFAIRPSAVTLFTNASAVAPSALATPIFGAGTPFTLYATTTTGTNYNETLTQYPGKLTAQDTTQDTNLLGGGTVGTLSPAMLTANPSPSPSNNATYSEVGYLYLAPGAFRDDTYTSVDVSSGDCISNTSETNPPVPDYLSDVLVNGKYGCSIGNMTTVSLGRFVPDHFTVMSTVSNACGTFTYMGQPFTLSPAGVVEARNFANGVTANYAGAYAPVSATLFGAENADNGIDLGGSLVFSATGHPLSGTWTAGIFTLTDGATDVTFTRPTTPSGPFEQLNIGLTVTDTDVATVPRVADADFTPGAIGGAATYRSFTGSPLRMRFGILRLDNAYGSELLPIRVPVRAMYCNAVTGTNCTEWRTNTDDACTALASTMGSLPTYAGSLATSNFRLPPATPLTDPNTGTGTTGNWMTASSTLLGSGAGTLVLNKPCIGGPGAACTAATGSADLTFTVPAWLRGTWTSSGAWDESPRVRLKFGSPKAPYIYLRERY